MPKLIDVNEILKSEHQHYDYMADEYYVTVRDIENAPPVDAVPKADYDHLLKRFKHLIQSDYIKSFDAWDSRKNDYVLDIRDAVEVVRCEVEER